MAYPRIWVDEDVAPQPCRERPITYVLRSASETLLALGQGAVLPEGPLGSLAERTAQFFSVRTEGPDVLVGALPFDPAKPAFLVQPERMLRVQGHHDLSAIPGLDTRGPSRGGPARVLSATPEPSAEDFMLSVEAALAALSEGGALRKIVLSRSIRLRAGEAFSAADLVRTLSRDEGVTVFATPLPPVDGIPRALVGATPELLLDKRGGRIASHPLAGSARRSADPGEDRRAGEHLLSSEKDLHEHAIVVESILDLLSPHCVDLAVPEAPVLRPTASMWHLGTRITGRLKDASLPSQALVALLHPTPAVCGLPRQSSHRAIERLEAYDRDFYAGAVGWCDAAGDGRWFVSIRCAELAGDQARVYAGAGIVPGSTPRGELAETTAKFQAMLDGFGIDADRYRI